MTGLSTGQPLRNGAPVFVPVRAPRQQRFLWKPGRRNRFAEIRIYALTNLSEVANMPIAWKTDVDAGLAAAREQGQAVLLDFSAAPM